MQKSLDKILKFRDARDWKQFHEPKNLAIGLVLEAAEVLELFKATKDNQLPQEERHNMERELADVYSWILLLAHDLGIDLEKAFSEKMEENEKKYPVEKSKGNSKKYTKL